jgi:AraC-like DNA-binding protein
MARKYLDSDDRVIPPHFPRLLVEVASEQGAERAELLEGTELDAATLDSPDTRLSFRQCAVLLRNALRLTGNPGLGIDVGRRVQPSNLGMLGLAAMSSPDTKTALELGLRYYRTLGRVWDMTLDVKDRAATITFRATVPLRGLHVYMSEVMLVSLATLARTLLGHSISVKAIELDYPKPRHFRRYAEVLDGPVSFGRPVTRVLLDLAVLEDRLPGADPATLRVAERHIAAAISEADDAVTLVEHVRGLLEASRGNYPSLRELARALHTSERTLRRELEAMGTSYQALLDVVRCKHATELLEGTDLSINEIAEKLGFSEGSALRRAFKRWTGWTATKYRADKRATRSAA